MKIQILGLNYAPEAIGTGFYSTGLAEDLARRGHQVTVVCAHPYYPQWRVLDGWPRFGYRTDQTDGGPRVIHCPLYVPRKPSAKSRILHYLSFAMTSLPRLLGDATARKPDVVLLVAPSLVSALSGWITARLSGARLWLHVQDFEVEAAFATGAIDERSRIAKLALGFERWMLRKFDCVSSISQPMLAKLRDKGVPDEKVFELRNWANLNRIKVIDGPSPMRDELAITTPYVAFYSGNIAAKQGLEIIPETARLLADRNDLTFVICGDGPFLETLKDMATGLENIRFYPLQPFEKLSDALGMADVHLLPQIAGVADLVLPSKLTNMLASGRPVIATAQPGTALANEVEGCGLITEPGNAEALATALEGLLNNTEARAHYGKSARRKANQNWDMGNILDRFEAQLIQLTATGADGALVAPKTDAEEPRTSQ